MKQANAVIRKEIDSNKEFFSSLRRSDFSHQVKGCMHRQGITLADIGERLGVSSANLSRMLNGKQNITIDNIYALADALQERLILALESSLKGTSWINELSSTHQEKENAWEELSHTAYFTHYSPSQNFSCAAANDEISTAISNSCWSIDSGDICVNAESVEEFDIYKEREYA